MLNAMVGVLQTEPTTVFGARMRTTRAFVLQLAPLPNVQMAMGFAKIAPMLLSASTSHLSEIWLQSSKMLM
jgi:hypothetical protein